MEFEESSLRDACERALNLAKQKGASSAEVCIITESGFSTTSRLGEIESLEHNRDRGLSLNVYFGQRSGVASSSDIDAVAIENAVEKACAIAKFTDEDPFCGLADKDLLATSQPELNLYFPWDITPEQGFEVAKRCEQIALGLDKQIVNSEGSTFSTYSNFMVYANSNNFMGSYFRTAHHLDCSLIAQNGGNMQRDYYYTSARDHRDLISAEIVAQKAVKNTVDRLGSKPIKTQNSPVIFKTELAQGLIRSLLSAINGNNIYRNSSFLVDHLGQQVFPNYINIYQRPFIPKATGSKPFDNEGVATRNMDFIKDGILQSYVLDTYSSRKLKLKSTGNAGGVQNILIDSSDIDLPGLFKKMDRGLYITELMGQGINIVTGDYSRGAFGYWIENGQIKHPVEGITIAGNLKDMFKGIVAVSNDVDTRGVIRSGSILIDNMTIAA